MNARDIFHSQKMLEDNIELAKKYFRTPTTESTRRDYVDQSFKFQCVWSQLLALTDLRKSYSFGDADQALREGIEMGRQAARQWKIGSKLSVNTAGADKTHTASGWKWNTTPAKVYVVEFPFATTALLELIFCKFDRISPDVLSVTPKPGDWKNALNGFHLRPFFDAALLEVMAKGRRPRCWGKLFSHATDLYERRLVEKSWDCYADIVIQSATGNWDQAIALLDTAHDFFSKRKNCEPHEFASWEECGPKNEPAIDLRLSAIISHCFSGNKKLYKSIASPHKW